MEKASAVKTYREVAAVTVLERLTISVKEAAKLSGFGQRTLYDLCHTEGFPAIWVTERHVRIHREQFIQWVEKRAGAGKPS